MNKMPSGKTSTARTPEASDQPIRQPPTVPRYSASLEHGLVILACFSSKHPVRGIADIAEEVGMSRSTTHRYVTTLLALGYLEQPGADRKYRLASHASDLGMAAVNSLGVREPALPHLQALRSQSRCTASLAILDGQDILYVARVRSYLPGQHEIDLGLRVGARLPAYCTAVGKLLVAYLPEEERRGAIKALKIVRRTPHTIASKTMLHVELERIREREVAVNDRELVPSLHAIALPVRAESGDVIAAVSIAAHISHVSHEQLVHELKPHLATAAARISAHLGYSGDNHDDDVALGQAA